MSALRRSKHAVYELKYHFVWIPKYRKRITQTPRDFLPPILSLFSRRVKLRKAGPNVLYCPCRQRYNSNTHIT